MHRSLGVLAALLLASTTSSQEAVIPGRVVLKPDAAALADLDARLKGLGLTGAVTRTLPAPRRADPIGVARIRTLAVAPGTERAIAAKLDAEPWTQWAAPLSASGGVTGDPPAPPSDPFYDSQWTLSSPSDIDMDVPEAWAKRGTYHADSSVVVAVIDTGHPINDVDLNTWVNPVEVVNGIDDDGNGFVDDIAGWDFVNDDRHPTDDQGHGTSVSAILGATTDNAISIAGIASGVQVMPLKAFNFEGDFPSSGPYAGTASAAAALIYATDMGADLINNSWGVFSGFDPLVNDAVDYGLENGVHMTCGAGNFDETFFFPAEKEGLIAVAAIDSEGEKSVWFGAASNYGPWVDVCAGGSDITSAGLSGVVAFAGTSAAAPNAAGVAALVLSEAPDLAREDLRAILMESAVSVDALNPAFAGQLGAGHVNALAALELLDPVADLGGGLAGTAAPVLNAWGATDAGGTMSVAVSGLAPGTPCGLVVGNLNASLPAFGGVLVPNPLLVLLRTADASGRAEWVTTLPSDLTGVTLYLQAGAVDGGAPQGFAISNALSYSG